MFHKKNIEKYNGIEFTRRNRITLTNKIRISPLLKLLQYMLVVAGVYGTVFSFVSGLDIPVHTPVLIITIFLSALYFNAVFMAAGYMKYSLPLSLFIYFGAGYVFWDEIKNGFWHLENIYITYINDYYNTSVLKYLVEDYNESTVITVFFIFVAIMLSLLISFVILRNAFRAWFVLITLPIVLSSFIVGYIPSRGPFGIYLACMISIIGIGTTLREKHRHFNLKSFHGKQKVDNRLLEKNFKYVIGLKIGGFLSVLVLTLIMLTSIIVTPDFYARAFNIADTKQKIQKEMMEFNLEEAVGKISSIDFDGLNLFKGMTASGGLSGGKLGRIGEVNFNYQTALRIKTPVIGTSMYLKGYVGSIYKGNSWTGLTKKDLEEYNKIARSWEQSGFTIGNQNSYFLSLINDLDQPSYPDFNYYTSKIDVTGINSNPDYIYAPYYSDYSAETMEVTDSEYVTPKKKQTSYTFYYYGSYNNLFQFEEETEYQKYLDTYNNNSYDSNGKIKKNASVLKRLEEYRNYEQAYRKFVYDTYTKVPDTGLERIKKQYGSIKYSEYKEEYGIIAADMIIDMVRNDLYSETSYSLTPGILPKDKDFVEYFLYENKTGYCSHYASAAAMIFRTIGIPARYVEGYIVKPTDMLKGSDDGKTTIKERMNGRLNEYQVIEKSIDIPDANAHAWVEIYLDGFGWIPIEVTPGFTGSDIFDSDTDGLLNQGNSQRNNENSVQSPSPTPAQDSDKDKSAEESENNKNPEQTSPEDKENSDKDGEASETGAVISGKEHSIALQTYLKKLGFVVLWCIGLIAGVILFLWLRALLITKKRKNNQKTRDFSKRVLLRYKEIGRMFDYYNIKVSEDLTCQEAAAQIEKDLKLIKPGRFKRFMDIVLKARFNQYCISKEESEEAEEFYQELIGSAYKNTGKGGKIILKYIKVFR